MEDGAGNFMAELVPVVEVFQQRAAIDGDAVGETVVVEGALGEWGAGIEAVEGFVEGDVEVVEKVFAGFFLDDELDVVEVGLEFTGNQFE